MCAPIAGLALAGTIASGVAGAVGTYAKIAQDNAQASVAQQNAANEQTAAVADQTAMNQQALRQYMQISQTEGQQRAQAAANGVAVGYGTPAQQVSDTALLGSMDVNQIYQQGLFTERGHDVAVTNDLATASAARSNALFSGIGGALSIAGSVAGGVASAQKTAFDMRGGTVLGGAGQYTDLASKMGIGNPSAYPDLYGNGLVNSTNAWVANGAPMTFGGN